MNKYANMSKNKGSKGQQNSMQNNAMGSQGGMQSGMSGSQGMQSNSQYANGGQMQSNAQIDQNIENYKKAQQKNSLQ